MRSRGAGAQPARPRARRADRCPAPPSALPGVVAVLTVHEAPELGASRPAADPRAGVAAPTSIPVMAGAKVRHVGEAVAVVVADDPYRAADAVEAVIVEYEPLPVAAAPVVAGAGAGARRLARQPRRPPGGRGRRCRPRLRRGRGGRRGAGSPTRASPACRSRGARCWRRRTRRAGGSPCGPRRRCRSTCGPPSPTALGLPEDSIRVIAPDVGGGFGIKGHVYPEDVLIPAVARRLGRPGEVGGDAARALPHRLRRPRPGAHRAARRCGATGRSPALETTFARDHGAFPDAGRGHDRQHDEPPGRSLPRAELPRARRQRRHPQDVRRRLPRRRPARGRARARPAARPRRARPRHGPGRAAPAQPDPPRGDAVSPPASPTATACRSPTTPPTTWPPSTRCSRASTTPAGARSRPRGAAARARSASACRPTSRAPGSGPFEGADVTRRSERGRLRRRRRGRAGPGSRDHAGPDLRDRARRAARARGRARRRHRSRGLRHGHDRQPRGGGGRARPSRARPARSRARRGWSRPRCSSAPPTDVVVAEGDVWVAGSPHRRVAARPGRPRRRPQQGAGRAPAGPASARACSSIPNSVTWAFGAQAAVVEVDLETCTLAVVRHAVVHDCGRSINPMVVEGQVHGGTAQGLGSALLEEVVHDDEGQLLTGSLMDYALPRAADFPDPRRRPRRVPVHRQRARHQGRGRERRHLAGRDDRRRGRGRAGGLRRRDHAAAGDAGARLRGAARDRALAAARLAHRARSGRRRAARAIRAGEPLRRGPPRPRSTPSPTACPGPRRHRPSWWPGRARWAIGPAAPRGSSATARPRRRRCARRRECDGHDADPARGARLGLEPRGRDRGPHGSAHSRAAR